MKKTHAGAHSADALTLINLPAKKYKQKIQYAPPRARLALKIICNINLCGFIV